MDRGQIRQSTGNIYRQRLRTWLYSHGLEDGRTLGDVPVHEATREMFGAVIARVLTAGRSRAIVDGIRFPLRGCYEDLIERKVRRGPNPAADLWFFIGKGPRSVAEAATSTSGAGPDPDPDRDAHLSPLA